MTCISERLRRQLDFLVEIDKVKSIFRKTRLFDGSRHENDAEHAWSIAIMAVILAEYANEPNLDVSRVIRMLLIHDLVEIDAGDVAVYDTNARAAVKDKELQSAERVFGLLPEDQRQELFALWQEFEARKTPEAKFAASLDRLEPVMQNYYTAGRTWKELEVSREKVLAVNAHVAEGSEILWSYLEFLIEETFTSREFSEE